MTFAFLIFLLTTNNCSTVIYSILMHKTYHFNFSTYVKLKFYIQSFHEQFHIIFSNLSSFSIIVNPIAEIAVPIACIQTPMSAIILSSF